MITVAIINQSTVLSDANVAAAVPALQVQVTRDFAPLWATDAKLVFVGQGQTPPVGAWQLIVLDDSDQAGALGYHQTKVGVPVGFVFARTDLQAGLNWTVTCSHELLELLADPFVISTAYRAEPRFRQAGYLLALEVADACEADQFAYSISVPGPTAYEVKVSDFVTPAWFGAELPQGGKYSFMGHCTQPFQILPGGYIGAMQIRGAGQWTQINGRMAEEAPAKWLCHQLKDDGTFKEIEPPKGSRRERRGRQQVEQMERLAQSLVVANAPPTALFGPVRNDIDQLVQHAEGSLAKVDNVTGWIASLISQLAQDKAELSISGTMFGQPYHVKIGVEPKQVS